MVRITVTIIAAFCIMVFILYASCFGVGICHSKSYPLSLSIGVVLFMTAIASALALVDMLNDELLQKDDKGKEPTVASISDKTKTTS